MIDGETRYLKKKKRGRKGGTSGSVAHSLVRVPAFSQDKKVEKKREGKGRT